MSEKMDSLLLIEKSFICEGCFEGAQPCRLTVVDKINISIPQRCPYKDGIAKWREI